MSSNAKKVIGYLRDNAGKNVTSNDVAAALGVSRSTVDGTFTGLWKKGYGDRIDGTVIGTADVNFLSVTDTGATCDMTDFSDGAKAILTYLRTNPGDVTLDDVAAAAGMAKRTAGGTFNALVKKDLCKRTSATIETPIAVKYLVLTDIGMTCDVDAE